MLFERFLKKKRPLIVEVEDQHVLVDRALHHDDPAMRREATRQLLGFGSLREILTTDPDVGVREVATARYRHLLCAEPSADLSVSDLVAEVTQLQDAHMIEQISVQAVAPEVRRSAIERLESPEALVVCAVQDPRAANRSAAVERLHGKAALEQVVRQIGKRDKNVYRAARERLRLIAEQEERPRRIQALCEELCQKVERLGRLEHWTQDRALLDHLDRQWSDISAEAEPHWQTRYTEARDRFMQAYGGHTRETAARIAAEEAHESLQAERLQLLDRLAQAPGHDTDEAITTLCEEVKQAWDRLEALPPHRQRPLDQRYTQLLEAAEGARDTLIAKRKRVGQLHRLSNKLTTLCNEPRPLDRRASTSLIGQSRTLIEELGHVAETAAFASLLERLESRLKTQHKHAEQRLKQLPAKLDELEEALCAGELRKADPLFQSARAGLELIELSGLPKETYQAIATRLQHLAPRLRELQNWRRWGADQHRDALCEDMEQLAASELSPATRYEQLIRLRSDWKELDKTGPRANQAVWERFQQASNRVQDDCRPFIEEQAAARESNRLARESVCDQIEDFLAKIDWERVDWKRVLRAERETRQIWAAIGPVEPRHVKALEGRFRHALKQLDRRLDAERKRNQAMKQALVQQIEALREEPDLDAAIERTKVLQRQWQTTVPARHKEENKLWQSFRAACDSVFERRAALNQAHADELKAHLATREAICTDALAQAEQQTDPRQLDAALKGLERRWEEAQSLPIPRQHAGALNEQWRNARATLKQRIQAGEEQQRRAAFDLLERQATICERLERTLLDETCAAPISAEEAEQAWAQLPRHPEPEIQEAISARFTTALTAAHDLQARHTLHQRQLENAERRGQLCLQLEILAGVETPRELAQQRMEFQVARLTERMVDGEDDPLQGSARLLREWYLCGPAPLSDGMDARFARVRTALAETP
ncbi:hypothetical protein CKO25_08690 [Thiocapsa imhoffii]|uniref:DUF349 domain-containing protein n=1 Tax=Thiocapsa imhoffii TaxID=382777 RepID=A0A9X0WIH2_9GAMM|nr:DUF349 domain-containing protein [Thiocapsa imhoffii]MBK1644722.1 hypothetical protein [Thiocapsa imhoffii]